MKPFNVINATNAMVRCLAAALLWCMASVALAQTASADGEIRKIDLAAGRVVIRHGEWKGMSMGAMTMGFKVRPASLLEGVKVADKVHFLIEKEGNDFVVTGFEPIDKEAAAQ